MKKYFDSYKEARKFMENIEPNKIIDYGRTTVMGETRFYVEYIFN